MKMKGTTIALICNTHGFVKGDHCPECRKQMSLRVDGANIQVFKPMVYTDICETPILITSKQHLRRECKKHNVIAARLL